MGKFCGWCGAALEAEVCGSCGTSSAQPRLAPSRPLPAGWGFTTMAGLSGAAVVATLAMGAFVIAKQTGVIVDQPWSAIGTCWTPSGDGSYEEVGCRDKTAQYRIVRELTDISQCPEDHYFETGTGEAYCTEVVKH